MEIQLIKLIREYFPIGLIGAKDIAEKALPYIRFLIVEQGRKEHQQNDR